MSPSEIARVIAFREKKSLQRQQRLDIFAACTLAAILGIIAGVLYLVVVNLEWLFGK